MDLVAEGYKMNKKLLILAVAGTISIILGGINSTTLYGTQYLLSGSGFSYSIAPWWDSGWSYRKPITINSSQVDADLTNFPILVNITDTDLRDDAQVDGDDITFIQYYGCTIQLNHEIELFNGTTGELVAWVNVTTLNSSSDTVIYMYYGNSSCSSQENIVGVWDGSHVMVHHLNETTDPHEDSTSYNNDGNESGGVNQSATGKIDGADWFDGNDDYFDCGNGASLNIRNAITLEAWVNMDERPDKDKWHECIIKDDYSLYLYGSEDTKTILATYFWIDGVEVDLWDEGVVDINPNNWTHCVITFNGTDIKAYVNGQLDFTYNNSGTIDDSSAVNLLIGAWITEADGFYGTLDEVRISNIARNVSWINTNYNTMNNTSTFISVGDEETQS